MRPANRHRPLHPFPCPGIHLLWNQLQLCSLGIRPLLRFLPGSRITQPFRKIPHREEKVHTCHKSSASLTSKTSSQNARRTESTLLAFRRRKMGERRTPACCSGSHGQYHQNQMHTNNGETDSRNASSNLTPGLDQNNRQ